eukprot:jgi/Tetstr1/437494/TSEL_026173.t1
MPQDPDVIATQTVTGDVCIYNLEAEQNSTPQLVLKGPQEEGFGLAWNTQCQGRLLSCSLDATVCLWGVGDERGTMDPLAVFKHHDGPVGDVSWHSKDAHTFASVGDDKLLIVYDDRLPPVSAAVSKVVAHQDEIHCVAFHPAAEPLLATGSADHTLGLFDTRKLERPLHVMAHHSDCIYQISWNPHHKSCIASAGGDYLLMIWDLNKVGEEQAREDACDGPAELVFVHGGHTSRIQDFSWNPNQGFEWTLASVAEADDKSLQCPFAAAAGRRRLTRGSAAGRQQNPLRRHIELGRSSRGQRPALESADQAQRAVGTVAAMSNGSGEGGAASPTALRMVLVSAVALFDCQGRVLLAQRPEGKAMAGLWEFPGGKVEANESPEVALVRELQEELELRVEPSALAPITFASHTYEKFHLLMPLYGCTKWEGEPVGAEGQALQWVEAHRLAEFAMPEADIPLIGPVQAAAAKVTAGRSV